MDREREEDEEKMHASKRKLRASHYYFEYNQVEKK